MMNFRKIEVNDKKWMDPLLAAADMRGCQHNFTNLFAWSKIYKYRVARVEDYLVVKGESLDGAPYYLYPAGQGDPKSVIEAMGQDAATCGYEFILAGLLTENIAVINSLFPGNFEYTEKRDSFDIHIEKALEEIQGAYQMINCEFATLIQQNHPELIYFNREEDMGYEGLRKAKLSYHPVKMVEKYWGKFVGLKSV
jgi:hypothetical protein